jgi:hypothetical protein
MSEGFNNNELKVTVHTDEVQKILKDYKRIKRYMKSSIFEVKNMDGTEKVVKNLLKHLDDNNGETLSS